MFLRDTRSPSFVGDDVRSRSQRFNAPPPPPSHPYLFRPRLSSPSRGCHLRFPVPVVPLAAALVRIDAVLDSLDMPPAHSFDFAAQFEIPADLLVAQHAKTVDDRERVADASEDLVRVERQVRLVPHRQ